MSWERAKTMQESISRLSEVNNAEWERTQEFLENSGKPKKPTSNIDVDAFSRGTWKSIHAKALENDSEGVSDFIMGRQGATLTTCDAQTVNGWSALHVAAMTGANKAAASCIEGKADVFLKVPYDTHTHTSHDAERGEWGNCGRRPMLPVALLYNSSSSISAESPSR
jgi:hypothetical protein